MPRDVNYVPNLNNVQLSAYTVVAAPNAILWLAERSRCASMISLLLRFGTTNEGKLSAQKEENRCSLFIITARCR